MPIGCASLLTTAQRREVASYRQHPQRRQDTEIAGQQDNRSFPFLTQTHTYTLLHKFHSHFGAAYAGTQTWHFETKLPISHLTCRTFWHRQLNRKSCQHFLSVLAFSVEPSDAWLSISAVRHVGSMDETAFQRGQGGMEGITLLENGKIKWKEECVVESEKKRAGGHTKQEVIEVFGTNNCWGMIWFRVQILDHLDSI